jgi:hypothetical protein
MSTSSSMQEDEKAIIAASQWHDVEGVQAIHFIRDLESAARGNKWSDVARYTERKVMRGSEAALGEVAVFQSLTSRHVYDISTKLVPEWLNRGDKVLLQIAGCCTIVAIIQTA